ncbi:MAG: hypothetical protein AUK55_12760 [Syntrophobacteraceae bacterium CG2_30_61_12]|nr:MAG: hypothetical protein AUK55_12760 [Syntrophobacteraceae bacterium CG2_30_61_12]
MRQGPSAARRNLPAIALLCVVFAAMLVPARAARAGEMRIKLTDGNTLQVPYCWEEEGLIKFEIPGGTVGIPKGQVASIEEVITSKPFSPDTMSQREEVYLKLDEGQRQWFKDFIVEQTPKGDGFVTMNPEQVEHLLEKRAELKLGEQPKPMRIYSSSLERTGEIAEWVRLANGSTMLLLNNTVSSFEDLAGKAITLSLFDSEGQRIKQVRCDIRPLKANLAKMKELGVSGRLYALVAKVEPDPRVKRYEITTTRY